MVRSILIVEDDLTYGKMLQSWFKRNGFETVLCTHIATAKDEITHHSFSLILSDLRLPDGDGIILLQWMKEQKKTVPVILMTSYAEIQSAVSAMKLGAFDYLEKPVNPTILKTKIEQAFNHIEDTVSPQQIQTETAPVIQSDIVYGQSESAKTMHDHIRIVAPTQMSVLILGESGTGKEYAARLIHESSGRKNERFIAVDCGSLSRELAPSELFGHLKGSFTSAISDKKGVFEEAKGGTVFLDEIGNLPYEVQVQLLRALQEKKVRPVGSSNDITINVRILAATNEDLIDGIRAGKFREDLYHRLNEFSITVPPLRERKGDIAVFANHFLCEANHELGKSMTGFTAEALKALERHNWSGNLRELRNAVRRAALFAQSSVVTLENLPVLVTSSVSETIQPLRSQNEKEQIEEALRKTNGNKSAAAQLLQIDRKTLYNKIHLYGISL